MRNETHIIVARRELQRRALKPCDYALLVIAMETRWAKISTLAALSGMSEPAAHRAARRLRQAGLYLIDYRCKEGA